jgi:hypothetical protein
MTCMIYGTEQVTLTAGAIYGHTSTQGFSQNHASFTWNGPHPLAVAELQKNSWAGQTKAKH